MTRVQKALAGGACGIVLALMGANGWFGDFYPSFFVAIVGLLIFVASIGVLLSARSGRLGPPHPYIGVPFGFAAGLHMFECLVLNPGFSFGWFGWTMSPHLLALAISCCGTARVAAIAGGAAALLLDCWTFGRVFVVHESISVTGTCAVNPRAAPGTTLLTASRVQLTARPASPSSAGETPRIAERCRRCDPRSLSTLQRCASRSAHPDHHSKFPA
jgi:hypothetical protein